MLTAIAKNLVQELHKSGDSIVFCESCTAGLAAATLGQFPGVSKVLTGSFVVYQTPTKHDWLELPLAPLNDPAIGPVSEIVTRLLAEHGLLKSPTASIAAAVTGHLGPSASIADYDSQRLANATDTQNQPQDDDGTVFVAISARGSGTICHRFQLQSPTPSSTEDYPSRYARQVEATLLVYRCILDWLPGSEGDPLR